MGEINFVSESDSKKNRSRSRHSDDVEYTSGVEPAPKQPPHESSFAAWRKKRKEEKESTAVLKPNILPPASKKAKQELHPGVELVDDESPNLLDDLLVPALAAPRRATVPAPRAAQSMGESDAPLLHPDDAPDLLAGIDAAPAPATPPKSDSPKQPKEKKHQSRRLHSKGDVLVKQGETVNLIPNTVLEELTRRNRLRDLGYTSIALVALVFVAYGGLNYYQKQITVDTVKTEEEIATVEQEITMFAALQEESVSLNERLQGVTDILNQHVYWTSFLDELEQRTLPTVYYTSFSGSAASRQFTFDAVTTDYAYIDSQVQLFRDSEMVESVRVSSATASRTVTDAPSAISEPAVIEQVQFTVTVAFRPELFQYQPRTL